jgi:hypothetical protein
MGCPLGKTRRLWSAARSGQADAGARTPASDPRLAIRGRLKYLIAHGQVVERLMAPHSKFYWRFIFEFRSFPIRPNLIEKIGDVGILYSFVSLVVIRSSVAISVATDGVGSISI